MPKRYTLDELKKKAHLSRDSRLYATIMWLTERVEELSRKPLRYGDLMRCMHADCGGVFRVGIAQREAVEGRTNVRCSHCGFDMCVPHQKETTDAK